ncbi:MAG: N-carbamoylputrescine amidase [Pseudomonadota bacterium]
MRRISVAATQMACSWDREANIATAERLVRRAAEAGAQLVLIQELFEAPYFCIEQYGGHFDLATPVDNNPLIRHFQNLAAELEVVLPISWFERSGNTFFNSLCMIDASGDALDVYRKAHIPNSIGYQEKTYFTPGDTGFKVWDTRCGRIGAGICWDQWFPEAARAMALMGAEVLLYPTAIGSEPGDPDLNSREHWMRVMQGHAAANIMPLVASNRIGREVATQDDSLTLDFYGSSFIADYTGAVVEQADENSETVLVANFDLDEIADYRRQWGVFRDRRTDLYGVLQSHGTG